jgi:predicted nucleic acid-binding Zn ribbon protein
MNSGPEPLKEILSRLFTARGWGRRQGRLQLDRAWAAAAGEEYAAHSRVLGLKRGIIEIEVDSSVLLQELAHYHKRRLLQELSARLPGQGIKEMRFRAGAQNTKLQAPGSKKPPTSNEKKPRPEG